MEDILLTYIRDAGYRDARRKNRIKSVHRWAALLQDALIVQDVKEMKMYVVEVIRGIQLWSVALMAAIPDKNIKLINQTIQLRDARSIIDVFGIQ